LFDARIVAEYARRSKSKGNDVLGSYALRSHLVYRTNAFNKPTCTTPEVEIVV